MGYLQWSNQWPGISNQPKPGQSEAPARVPTGKNSQSIPDLFRPILTTLQSRLFDLGADLATPSDTKHESKIKRIDEQHIAEAENWIDQVEADV